MKKKFTETEIRYLRWLYESHDCPYTDEFCNQCNVVYVLNECFIDEQIVYSKVLPFKPDRRALRNLRKSGMLYEEPNFHHGLEWYCFWLSNKGRKFMKEQS